MCGHFVVHQNALYFYDKTTNSESTKDTPVVSVEDLPTFFANLLDCEEKDRLTWNNGIPKDEVWIKIGGDHGGNSFKLVLQIANVDNPNAKENTFLVCMVECRDSVENLRKILGPEREQINRLDGIIWKEKKTNLRVFGDYDFLLKLYGISGAQSCHPCLSCKASRERIQKSPTDQPTVEERTLNNIRSDFRKFRRTGSKPSSARVYNNVVAAPIWDIELTHAAPIPPPPPTFTFFSGSSKSTTVSWSKNVMTLTKLSQSCCQRKTTQTSKMQVQPLDLENLWLN